MGCSVNSMVKLLSTWFKPSIHSFRSLCAWLCFKSSLGFLWLFEMFSTTTTFSMRMSSSAQSSNLSSRRKQWRALLEDLKEHQGWQLVQWQQEELLQEALRQLQQEADTEREAWEALIRVRALEDVRRLPAMLVSHAPTE